MKNPRQYIGLILFSLFILVLLVPFIQYRYGILEERDLDGQFDNTVYLMPQFSIDKYFDETFQEEFTKFWQSEMGLKNRLIRVNNEINFRLFNRTSAADVITGKNNVIFPESYITSYLGKDFIGKAPIERFLDLTKEVQDSLTQKDKFFFILIAPGKASIYRESIPDSYFEENYGDSTNYDVFIPLAESKGIQVLDLRKYIEMNKAEFEYPIFPQYGLHWTGYTISQVADTLLRYIENGSGRNLPEVQLDQGITTVENYRWTDYDMGEGMNLWWHASDELLAYPELSFPAMPESKPAILGVGDSFLQSFYGFYPILDSAFNDNSQLWYYNRMIDWPPKYQPLNIKPKWLNWSKRLDETDIIVLEMTEENIRQLGYGFVEDLSDHIHDRFPKKEDDPERYKTLLEDPYLNNMAEKYHAVLGYSVDEMLHQLVLHRLDNDWLNNFDFDKEVNLKIKSIYNDPDWLNSVKEKAIKNNISLQEAVRLDAIWVVNQKLGKN